MASTEILSYVQSSDTNPEQGLRYYDQLRLDPNIKHEIQPGSNVIEVELPFFPVEGENDAFESSHSPPVRKYRLCHLSAFIALSTGSVRRENTEGEAGAILLAIYHLNNGIDAVVPQLSGISERCNVRFTANIYDTAFSPIGASRILSKTILGPKHSLITPHPVGLIGTYRSAVSMPLATLGATAKNRMVQISNGASSTELDNKELYPFFGRTISTTDGDAVAAVKYIHGKLNVTHCGVLVMKDAWGMSYQRAFQSEAQKLGIKVVTVSISFADFTREEVRRAIRKLKETKYRYFFGLFFNVHYDMVMEEAYNAGIAGDDSFWLLSDGVNYETFQANTKYEKDSPLAKVSHGIGFFHILCDMPGVPGREGFDKFLQEWTDMNHPEIKEYVKNTNPILQKAEFNFSKVPSQFAFFAYDAAIAYGLAACGTDDNFFNGSHLYNSFLESRFDGASGPVTIDNSTGNRDFHTIMYFIGNSIANEPDDDGMVTYQIVRTAMYTTQESDDNGSPIESKWVRIPEAPLFNYTDKTLIPPPVLPLLEEQKIMMGIGVRSVGLALCGLILLTSFYVGLWAWRKRHTRIVCASQPFFIYLMCIGTFIMGCGIIPSSLEEPIPQEWLDISCMSTVWLLNIGFVLVFSSLFAKTWRVNKIYHNNAGVNRAAVGLKDVMGPPIILFSLNVIFLIIWTFLAPLRYERVYREDSLDFFGRPIVSYGTCKPHNDWRIALGFAVILFALNFSMVLFAYMEMYQTRDVSSEYSESQFIAIALVTIPQVWFTGIPLMILFWTNPLAKFLLQSVVIFFTCEGILLLMYVPKKVYIYNWKQESKTRDNSVTLPNPESLATFSELFNMETERNVE